MAFLGKNYGEVGFPNKMDRKSDELCYYSIIFCFGERKTSWHDTSIQRDTQGDPLSPYLFLLCAEGFTTLLAKAELDGKITGVSIYRGASRVTNLLFADDSLLFC